MKPLIAALVFTSFVATAEEQTKLPGDPEDRRKWIANDMRHWVGFTLPEELVLRSSSNYLYHINPRPSLSVNPYRLIDGKTNIAAGSDWFWINGKISQTAENGVLVFGEMINSETRVVNGDFTIFIENFPEEAADGTELSEDAFLAKRNGFYEYTSVSGARTKVVRFDYGVVVRGPWKRPEAAMIKAVADDYTKAAKSLHEKRTTERKAKIDQAALKFNQTQAEKGDAQGLFRMGERYRDGDGVEPDPAKARDHFQRAQAAGHPDAAKALAELVESP